MKEIRYIVLTLTGMMTLSCAFQQHSGNPHVIKRPVVSSMNAVATYPNEDRLMPEIIRSPELVLAADTTFVHLEEGLSYYHSDDAILDTLEADYKKIIYAAQDTSLDTLFESLTDEQQKIAKKAVDSYKTSLAGGISAIIGGLLALNYITIGWFLLVIGSLIALVALFPGMNALIGIGKDPALEKYKGKALYAVVGGILNALIWIVMIGAVSGWFY